MGEAKSWKNLNGISDDDKTCGITDMNCLGEDDDKTCGITDMNCVDGQDLDCALDNMNCGDPNKAKK